MSLLEPTAGEMVDRVTILALKLAHVPGAIDGPLHREFEELQNRINARFLSAEGPVYTGWTDLIKINTTIWVLTMEMEGLLRDGVTDAVAHRIAYVAAEIHQLNKERAEAKATIDKATGEYAGGEKFYSSTRDAPWEDR